MNFKIIVSILIMYVGFLANGVLYESLLPKKSLGAKSFNYPNALLFFMNLCNCLSAFIALLVMRSPIPKKPLPFLKVAIPQQIGLIAGKVASKYINYPTFSLLKCAKPVSVMLCQLLIFKKKIDPKRIIVVILLCTGLAVFGISGNFEKSSSYGVLLACVALFCDAIYVPFVDQLKAGNSPFVIMLYSFMWSVLLTLPMSYNEIIDSIYFLSKNQEFIGRVLAYGIIGGIAHIALFVAIGMADGLVISIATTTRKFFTILLSAIIYKHDLNKLQWTGIVIVFASLGIEIIFKQKKNIKKD